MLGTKLCEGLEVVRSCVKTLRTPAKRRCWMLGPVEERNDLYAAIPLVRLNNWGVSDLFV